MPFHWAYLAEGQDLLGIPSPAHYYIVYDEHDKPRGAFFRAKDDSWMLVILTEGQPIIVIHPATATVVETKQHLEGMLK